MRFHEGIDAMATEDGWAVQSNGKLRALYGKSKSKMLQRLLFVATR